MSMKLASRYPIVFVFISIILVAYASSLCAGSLINVSVDNELYTFSDNIYDLIARLIAKGFIEDFPKNIYPYSRGDVAKMLTYVSSKAERGEIKLSAIEEKQLSTMKSLFSDVLEKPGETQEERKAKKPLLDMKGDGYYFSVGGGISQGSVSRRGEGFSENGTVSITSLQPCISGHVKDSFAFSNHMNWEFHAGDIFSDLFPDGVKHSAAEIHMENSVTMQGYARFKLPWFELEFGKDNVQWGPGYHGQLMMSDDPQSMDMVRLDARYGRIGFQSFTAKLESGIGDKYISAHRVEGIIWKGVNLGLSEVIIYGDRFEPIYLNPFQIYFANEFMKQSDLNDNVVMGIDFSHRVAGKFQVYSELVVDDASPFEYPANHWDTKFGLLGGMYIADPFSISDTDFRAEYAFINQYCYTHERPINTYEHINSPIGHWLGSDADDLWCEVKHRFSDKIESILTYEFERHGEGGIDKPHPKDAPANDKWTFLSGITQSKHSFSVGLSYTKVGYYFFKAKYMHSWVKNMDNSRSMDGIGRQVILKGSYWF